jgi:hypothetical protein
MNKLANHKIGGMIAQLEPFTNYNGTITARHDSSGEYVIRHWSTEILRYDTNTNTIQSMAHGFISQTTSLLIGRIVRNLPDTPVRDYLAQIDSLDSKRISKMLARA